MAARFNITRVGLPGEGGKEQQRFRIINDNFQNLRDRIDRLALTNELVVVGDIEHGALGGLEDDDHELYHDDARALAWLATRSTSDLPEGTNLYWTDVRFDTKFGAEETLAALASAAAQGDVVYYNGSAWVRLSPGTAGDVLTTQGAAADPTWETPSAGGGGSAPSYLSTGSLGWVWVGGFPLELS